MIHSYSIIRVQRYVEEIIQHLISVDSAKVKVLLEVEAKTDEGFNRETIRIISENGLTLRVWSSGFEEQRFLLVYSRIVISTRRFRARPALLELSPTGFVPPQPL